MSSARPPQSKMHWLETYDLCCFSSTIERPREDDLWMPSPCRISWMNLEWIWLNSSYGLANSYRCGNCDVLLPVACIFLILWRSDGKLRRWTTAVWGVHPFVGLGHCGLFAHLAGAKVEKTSNTPQGAYKVPTDYVFRYKAICCYSDLLLAILSSPKRHRTHESSCSSDLWFDGLWSLWTFIHFASWHLVGAGFQQHTAEVVAGQKGVWSRYVSFLWNLAQNMSLEQLNWNFDWACRLLRATLGIDSVLLR